MLAGNRNGARMVEFTGFLNERDWVIQSSGAGHQRPAPGEEEDE